VVTVEESLHGEASLCCCGATAMSVYFGGLSVAVRTQALLW